MAANPTDLRNRLKVVVSQVQLQTLGDGDGDAMSKSRSSRPMKTLRVPPNSTRECKSNESIQSEPPIDLKKGNKTKANLQKVGKVDSEIDVGSAQGQGSGDFFDEHEDEFRDRPVLKLRIGMADDLSLYLFFS